MVPKTPYISHNLTEVNQKLRNYHRQGRWEPESLNIKSQQNSPEEPTGQEHQTTQPHLLGLAPKPERAEAKSGMQFEPHHNKALPTLHIEKSDSPPPETKWTTKDAGNTKQDTSLLKQNQNTEDQLKKREPRLADTENQCKLQCASSVRHQRSRQHLHQTKHIDFRAAKIRIAKDERALERRKDRSQTAHLGHNPQAKNNTAKAPANRLYLNPSNLSSSLFF